MTITTFHPEKSLPAVWGQMLIISTAPATRVWVPHSVQFCYLKGPISDAQAYIFIPRCILSVWCIVWDPVCGFQLYFEHTLKQSNLVNPLCALCGFWPDFRHNTRVLLLKNFCACGIVRKALPLQETSQKATVPFLLSSSLTLWSSWHNQVLTHWLKQTQWEQTQKSCRSARRQSKKVCVRARMCIKDIELYLMHFPHPL